MKWIIIALVFGFVGVSLAKHKGRNQILWGILCTIIPLLVIAILLLPTVEADGLTKKCPHCAEIIKADASFCKHCGMAL
jgi:hypothetical protein